MDVLTCLWAWAAGLTHRQWSAVVLVSIPVFMFAWTGVAYHRRGNEATLSRVVLDHARLYPFFQAVLCVAWGMVLAHFVWPQTILVVAERDAAGRLVPVADGRDLVPAGFCPADGAANPSGVCPVCGGRTVVSQPVAGRE